MRLPRNKVKPKRSGETIGFAKGRRDMRSRYAADLENEMNMPEQDPVTSEKLANLNRRWMRAYTNGDVEFLEQHMSEDYIGTFPDGTVRNKTSEIEAVKSGAVKISEMEAKEMVVRVYDNAAVITGRSSIKAVVEGRVFSSDFRFTDVWILRDNRWQAVASQVTQVQG